MLKKPQRLLTALLGAGLALSAITAPHAQAASSAIPENPMVDPQGPPMISTGLNRSQETTLLQGLGLFVFSSTGTQSPGNCHLVPLSHQQFFCTIVSEIHYGMYPEHRNG